MKLGYVFPCFSLFFRVVPRFPLFSNVFPCFFYVFLWFSLFFRVFPRFPLFSHVFLYFSLILLVFPLFYHVSPVFLGFPLFSCGFPCFPMFVFLFFPVIVISEKIWTTILHLMFVCLFVCFSIGCVVAWLVYFRDLKKELPPPPQLHSPTNLEWRDGALWLQYCGFILDYASCAVAFNSVQGCLRV